MSTNSSIRKDIIDKYNFLVENKYYLEEKYYNYVYSYIVDYIYSYIVELDSNESDYNNLELHSVFNVVCSIINRRKHLFELLNPGNKPTRFWRS